MAKYFTFEEMIKSATADKLNINNYPTSTTIKNNLKELMEFLDMIRNEWVYECIQRCYGTPSIIVTSGYRCEALNEAVGGSKTSSHMIGTAADLKPQNGRLREFYEFLATWLKDNNIDFDELINEKPINGIPSWIHIGLRNSKGEQRKRVFTKN